jgi:subtilisin family serine protease
MAKKKQKTSSRRIENVVFEAALRPAKAGYSLFTADAPLAADSIDLYKPASGQSKLAATALQKMGFKIRHIGTFSVSGEGPRRLWEQVFSTKVAERRQLLNQAHPELGEWAYWSHLPDTPFKLPKELQGLVDRAYPQLPPTFFSSPLPPRVTYHHLNVPNEVALICRSPSVHKRSVTGKGVLVAMPDTGFFKHPFYAWHGYNYQATLSPDAIRVERDEYGHGTAEAANIFANAPDIDFIGVKMGANPTLAFKTASDLYPAVMTNSWGYSISGSVLPNSLKPLEAAVVEAVRDRGIVVCFSAGNGHYGFPAQMPEVIAVGGVYAHSGLNGEDFEMEASDYASSFDSQIYPGRHVPDVCGLVGMQPRAVYIMLPVEPSCTIDTGLAGGSYPNGDETAADDGWSVISGTSAASPQVAGVCALLKQAQPGLSPALVKAILRASARDVKTGQSSHGQPAGEGHDGATGAGIVDAYAAYQLARSIAPRDLQALPPPR